MNRYIVVDIETVANETVNAYVSKKKYYPAANLKDPAKIEQSVLQKRQADYDNAALQWWTGQVLTIGARVYDPFIRMEGAAFAKTSEDEAGLLYAFFDWLTSFPADQFTLIGKSSQDFDFPYLIGRAIARDLGVPDHLRPYGKLIDVDHIFSRSTACTQRTSLANYAWGMGIAGKLSHGSQVRDMYLQAQLDDTVWDQITDYCVQDVSITTELLKRFMKPFLPTPKPYAVMTEEEIPF